MNDQPNILFIITDQQRVDTIGAYGCELGATPTIDRMAAEGCRFQNAYCNNPLCMPSRASMLTGRYPSVNGVRTNGCTAYPDQPLMPEVLKAAGYHTAAFGKMHYHPGSCEEAEGYWPEHRNSIQSGMDLTQPYLGFDTIGLGLGHSDVLPGLHERELGEKHPEILKRRGPKNALEVPDELLLNAHKIQTYKSAVPTEHYSTNWVANQTIEYLEQVEGPFFAWCGFGDPHHPFNPPGEYWDRFRPEDMPPPVMRDGELDDMPPHYNAFRNGELAGKDTDGFLLGSDPYLRDNRIGIIRAAYFGMVAMIDDAVARILATLEARGLAENTIVFFLSDHGELLGDHDLILKGAFHYQPLINVPLIAYAPGLLSGGRVINGPVGLMDLNPTILELAGASIPEGTQARSMTEQLTGESDRGFDHALIEHDLDLPRDGSGWEAGLRLRTMVTDRYRMTHYAGEAYGELFDLEADPNEHENLWDRDVETRKEMQVQLLDLVAQSQSSVPPKISHA
jgi:arylsulfatase A-like enzyme